MGIDERGESVWLGMFLCEILDDWAVVLDRVGEGKKAAEYRAKRAEYAGAINSHAWETAQSPQHTAHNRNGKAAEIGAVAVGGGGWYRYGTKDNGEWVGAAASLEGKVHLNAQTWAVLADIAPADRAAAAWATVKERLLSPYGPLLLWPAYTEPDPTIGYVTRYCPGSRENGGVYMHAATWALAAACKLKDVDAVSRIWKSISPALRGKDAESYWAEPYVTPGNVDGPLSDKPGRAGWTWYTGSAAWLNRVSLEWVLGMRPVFVGETSSERELGKSGNQAANGESTGLLIDPCPPAELGRVSVTRTWRGRTLRVSFDSAEFARACEDVVAQDIGPGAPSRMEPVLTVNGQTMRGNVLTEAVLAAGGRAGTALPLAPSLRDGEPGTGARGAGAGGVVDIQVHWARGPLAVASTLPQRQQAPSQPGRV
jgi:cellobiose phosphorylase